MGKRSLNGAHPKIIFPATYSPLGTIKGSYLRVLSDSAQVDYLAIMSQLKVVSVHTSDDARQMCQRFADNDQALLHVYMSYYLLSLFQLAETETLQGRTQRKNAFLIGSMSQHELTQLCVILPPSELKYLYTWNQFFQFPRSYWETSIAGALSVARIAKALSDEGALVRLPTPIEDTVGKIDLIAAFPTRSEGLCIQVKTNTRISTFKFRALVLRDAAHIKDDSLRRFCEGTRWFQKHYRGIWIPVEMTLGVRSKHLDSLEMPEEVLNAIHRCLQTILEDHDQTTPLLTAAP